MDRDCVACDRKSEGVMVDTVLYGRWHESCLEEVHPHREARRVVSGLMVNALAKPIDHAVLLGN